MAIATPFPASVTDSLTSARRDSRPGPGRSRAHVPGTATAAGGSLRLTRRGRVVLSTLAAGVLSVIVVLSGQVTADAGSQVSGPASSVFVVQAGDSLWSIAQIVAPERDPRETIARIRDLNGMGSSTVIPGQSLVVPIHS